MSDFDIDAVLGIVAANDAAVEQDLRSLSDADLRAKAIADGRALRNLDPQGFETNEKGARLPRSPLNYERALQLLGVRLWHDDFAGRVMIVDGRGERHVRDADLADLRATTEALFHFLPERAEWWEHAGVVARRNAVHPVRDYLAALSWDGATRIDSWLADFCGAADTPYTRAVGRLFLVAAVRRVRQPGCKFDEMLVLEGEQGTGKSSALRALAVRDEWFSDGLVLGLDTRALVETIAGKWIVEAPEMRSGRDDDRERKSMLSRQSDRARPAYGRIAEEAPRQCVFAGSTNEAGWLQDATGNRRYLPVQTGRIDLAGLTAARDQLWAEAAAAEAAGASVRLPEALWPAAAAEQESRRRVDHYEELLEPLLDGVEGKVTTADVYALLGVSGPNDAQTRRAGTSMRRLGWQYAQRRQGGNSIRCWVRGSEDRWWTAAEVRGRGNMQPDLRVVGA